MTNVTSDLAFVSGQVDPAAKIIFLILAVLLLLCGSVGNLLLLLVLCLSRSMRTACNIFIAHLAFTNLFVVFSSLPFAIEDLTVGHHQSKSLFQSQLTGFIFMTSYTVCVLTLSCIAFNRYLLVCRTPLFRRLFSFEKNLSLCGLFWVLALCLTSPSLWEKPSFPHEQLTPHCRAQILAPHVHYSTIVLSIVLVVSTSVIAAFYAAIYRHRQNSSRRCLTRKIHTPQAQLKPSPPPAARRRWTPAKGKGKRHSSPGALGGVRPNPESLRPGPASIACIPSLPQQNRWCGDRSVERAVDLPGAGARHLPGLLRDVVSVPRHLRRSLSDSVCLLVRRRPKAEPDPEPRAPPDVSLLKFSERRTSSLPARTDRLKAAQSSAAFKKQLQSLARAFRERMFVRNLLIISVSNVVMFTPYVTVAFVSYFTLVRSEVALAANMFLFSKPCLTWVMYGALNRNVKKACRHMLMRCLPVWLVMRTPTHGGKA